MNLYCKHHEIGEDTVDFLDEYPVGYGDGYSYDGIVGCCEGSGCGRGEGWSAGRCDDT